MYACVCIIVHFVMWNVQSSIFNAQQINKWITITSKGSDHKLLRRIYILCKSRQKLNNHPFSLSRSNPFSTIRYLIQINHYLLFHLDRLKIICAKHWLDVTQIPMLRVCMPVCEFLGVLSPTPGKLKFLRVLILNSTQSYRLSEWR